MSETTEYIESEVADRIENVLTDLRNGDCIVRNASFTPDGEVSSVEIEVRGRGDAAIQTLTIE